MAATVSRTTTLPGPTQGFAVPDGFLQWSGWGFPHPTFTARTTVLSGPRPYLGSHEPGRLGNRPDARGRRTRSGSGDRAGEPLPTAAERVLPAPGRFHRGPG